MLLKTQFRKGLVRCQCWMKKRNHVRININLTSSPKRHKYHTGKHSVETIWINLNAISDEIKIVEIVEIFTHFSLYTAKRWNTWRVNRQWALTFRRLYTCFLVVKIVCLKVSYCCCHQTWRKKTFKTGTCRRRAKNLDRYHSYAWQLHLKSWRSVLFLSLPEHSDPIKILRLTPQQHSL